jgi:hypothetical protein
LGLDAGIDPLLLRVASALFNRIKQFGLQVVTRFARDWAVPIPIWHAHRNPIDKVTVVRQVGQHGNE